MIDGLKSYRQYKDSGVPWLGRIPDHWGVANLGRYLRVKSGDMISAEDECEFGVPIYGGNGIRGYTSKANTNGPVILIGRVGAKCGCIHLVKGKLWASEHALRVLPKAVINLGFFAHILEHADLNRFAIRTAQPLINSTIVRSHPVALPSEPEQTAIVRFLDHANRRIGRYVRTKRGLIALLNEQKQGIVHRAVTRGFDPTVPLKPSRNPWLGKIPEHWEEQRAKYFYREVDDRSPAGAEELLSVSHITGVTPRSQKNITMFMAASYIGHKTCEPGDIVINTMWAWMGALGIARRRGIVSPSYGVYRPLRSDAFVPEFVDCLLRTKPFVDEYRCRSTGIRSSRLRLYPEQFLDIPLIRPSYPEQERITAFVAANTRQLDNLMAEAAREIALTREYRTRLIADVVTGQLDVREAAARLPDRIQEPESLYTDSDDAEIIEAGEPIEAET